MAATSTASRMAESRASHASQASWWYSATSFSYFSIPPRPCSMFVSSWRTMRRSRRTRGARGATRAAPTIAGPRSRRAGRCATVGAASLGDFSGRTTAGTKNGTHTEARATVFGKNRWAASCGNSGQLRLTPQGIRIESPRTAVAFDCVLSAVARLRDDSIPSGKGRL